MVIINMILKLRKKFAKIKPIILHPNISSSSNVKAKGNSAK